MSSVRRRTCAIAGSRIGRASTLSLPRRIFCRSPIHRQPFSLEVLVDRRKFIAASAVAAVSPLPRLDKLDTLAQQTTRQFIELRRYHLLPGPKQRAFSTFVGEALVPAM